MSDEFYGLPEFFVEVVKTETVIGTDNVRAYHWAVKGSILCPLFTSILPATRLVTIGESVRDHALLAMCRAGELKN